jgi:hypothetical protein
MDRGRGLGAGHGVSTAPLGEACVYETVLASSTVSQTFAAAAAPLRRASSCAAHA